jgi:hypothetical protein
LSVVAGTVAMVVPPAGEAPIILSTVTDVAGFLSFLGLATLASGLW